MKKLFLCLFSLGISTLPSYAQSEALIVHEWGTITSQHYNNGYVAGNLNLIRQDEVLPDFVHRLDTGFLKAFMKTAEPVSTGAAGHPSVTMRLETPVIYFYLSKSFDLSTPIDVGVEFKGGLINEYFPQGEAEYKNIGTEQNGETNLTGETIGKLSWSGIKLDGSAQWPKTDFSVWLTPRETKSSSVSLPNGEGEKYLFYRGVAHLNSLLRTKHTMDTKVVSLYSPTDLPHALNENLTLSQVWVVQINEDDTAAFKEVGKVTLSKDPEQVLATVSVNFPKEEYSTKNLDLLRQAIHSELVENGLFEEESQAMLRTWDKAYFRNPGTRIFFIVPKEWINYYLPLTFSVPVQLERVLVGRIDLVI